MACACVSVYICVEDTPKPVLISAHLLSDQACNEDNSIEQIAQQLHDVEDA